MQLILWTCAILIVFEKLTCVCFFQIALKTMQLPILKSEPLMSPQSSIVPNFQLTLLTH